MDGCDNEAQYDNKNKYQENGEAMRDDDSYDGVVLIYSDQIYGRGSSVWIFLSWRGYDGFI